MKKFLGLGFSIASLLALFLPVASAGIYFINIGHLGGIIYLLYILAPAALVLSVISLYKPDIRYLKIWLILAAMLGLLITILAVVGGKEQLNYMSQTMNGMSSFFGEQNAAKQVEPGINSGGILAIVGYLGLLITSAIRKFNAISVLGILLIGSLTIGTEAIAEEPRPFGLIIGKSNIQDARATIQKEGASINAEGNRIIEGDISNPAVQGLEVIGLPIPELKKAFFWFYKGTLMEVVYMFSASMDKSEFYQLTDQLSEKYGKPGTYRKPNLADGLATWKFKDLEVKISVLWVGTATTIIYENPQLRTKANAEDKKVYEQQVKTKARNQKGL
ncbi:MAG: hypothetical protein HYS21_13235 [Deltaproteobacteria bacterium]|nr:hypothetical protein [Deltaproteobacteria bacterium]